MRHYTTPKYWQSYNKLSVQTKAIADKNFELLKENSRHSSLRLKKAGKFWSVRAGLAYRALGLDSPNHDGIIWFWIGTHAQYDKLIGKK